MLFVKTHFNLFNPVDTQVFDSVIYCFDPSSTDVFSNAYVPGVSAFPHTPKKNYHKSINLKKTSLNHMLY